MFVYKIIYKSFLWELESTFLFLMHIHDHSKCLNQNTCMVSINLHGIHILINPKILAPQESSISFSFTIEHYKIIHQMETWKLRIKHTKNSASKEVERSHWCHLPNQIWNTIKKKCSLSNRNPYKPKSFIPLCEIFYWSLFKALIKNLVYSIHHLWIWDDKSNLWI